MFGFSEFVHDMLQERKRKLHAQERKRIYTIIQGNKTLTGEDLLEILKRDDVTGVAKKTPEYGTGKG